MAEIREALQKIVMPVMATIKNISKGMRTFKDKFGKDVHIHPNQERTFPMHPAHLPMLQKEAAKADAKFELSHVPMDSDAILPPLTPKAIEQLRKPLGDANRQFFADPAQTLGRPRPLVPKLKPDNSPDRPGAGPDFSEKPVDMLPPVNVPKVDPGPDRYDAIEDEKSEGTGRTDEAMKSEERPVRERPVRERSQSRKKRT